MDGSPLPATGVTSKSGAPYCRATLRTGNIGFLVVIHVKQGWGGLLLNAKALYSCFVEIAIVKSQLLKVTEYLPYEPWSSWWKSGQDGRNRNGTDIAPMVVSVWLRNYLLRWLQTADTARAILLAYDWNWRSFTWGKCTFADDIKRKGRGGNTELDRKTSMSLPCNDPTNSVKPDLHEVSRGQKDWPEKYRLWLEI